MEVCPSDQLRPSLTLSLDFDLWEGWKTGKKGAEQERGVNAVRSECSELLVCGVPIIPFVLRQEAADTVRKGLIKHCCHNQSRLNLDPVRNHSVVPLQTHSHVNLDDRVVVFI